MGLLNVRDRIVEHGNRYKLNQVAGTNDTYDLIKQPGEITEEGTPINSVLFLKIEEMLKQLADYGTVKKILAIFDTAGTYTYTIPEGTTKIDVAIIGAGGSGGCYLTTQNTTSGGASGGASGYLNFIEELQVTPGSIANIVVGAKGNSVTRSSNGGTNGKTGGTTSFTINGTSQTALGGEGGKFSTSSSSLEGASGGSPSIGNVENSGVDAGAFGIMPFNGDTSLTSTYNPRSGKSKGITKIYNSLIGSAGGSSCPGGKIVNAGGKNSYIITGHGSDGATNPSHTQRTTVVAENATGNGNGGGGACTGGSGSGTVTSGAGSDGLVLIFADR